MLVYAIEADKGVVYRMSVANPFVHLELAVDFDDWFTWAVDNRIHKDVVGFFAIVKKTYTTLIQIPSRSTIPEHGVCE